MALKDNKIKDLTPLDVTFFEGESPTAQKLEGMMDQIQVGLEYLEGAVGDVFGEEPKFNTWLSSFARDIGDRSLVSPIILPNHTETNYQQFLTIGLVEHELDIIPVGDLATLLFSSADSSVVPGQWKATVEELEIPGDWTILSGYIENGRHKRSRKLVTHSPSDGGSITFLEATSGRGSSLERTGENTIPSIAQAENGGPYIDVTVADAVNNIYLVTLPLRDKMFDKTGQIVDFTASNLASGVGHNSQYELPPFFFGSEGLELEDDDGGGGPKRIPLNLIRLFDWNTKAEVEGIVEVTAAISPASRTYQFLLQMRQDVILDTVAGNYILTVPGNSLSDQLQALAQAVYNDSGRGTDMMRLVSHGSLMGLRTSSSSFGDRSEYYGPSNIDANDHSQYLHRNGYDSLDKGAGSNVMRGSIVVGNIDVGPDDNIAEHFNVLNDSHKVFFGNDSEGGSIGYDKVATHNIDHAYGSLASVWSDNTLLISGSVSDSNPALKSILLDGDVRTKGDVVLGENSADTIFIQGRLYVNDELTLIPVDHTSLTGEEGKIAYDDTEKQLLFHNGSAWIKPSEQSGYTVIIGDGVSTFGKYNGVDITPFNSAVADVAGAGGGTIKVLDGNYDFLAGALTVSNLIRIEGSGFKTYIKSSASAFNVIGDNVQIKNLVVEGTVSAIDCSGSRCLFDDLLIKNSATPISYTVTSTGSKEGSNVLYENVDTNSLVDTNASSQKSVVSSNKHFPAFSGGIFDWARKDDVLRSFEIVAGSPVLTYNAGSDGAVGKGNFEITGNGTITTRNYLPVAPHQGVGGQIFITASVGANALIGVDCFDKDYAYIDTKYFIKDTGALGTGTLEVEYHKNQLVKIGPSYEEFTTGTRYVRPVLNISGNSGSVFWDMFDIHTLGFARAVVWG